MRCVVMNPGETVPGIRAVVLCDEDDGIPFCSLNPFYEGDTTCHFKTDLLRVRLKSNTLTH